jgi:hypothetical protein
VTFRTRVAFPPDCANDDVAKLTPTANRIMYARE